MKKTFVSLLALVAATPALAQSEPASPVTNTDTDDVVVTATRSGDAIPAALLGSSVTVIDDKDLQARQTRFIVDVLRDVPGVAVVRGVGGLTEVRIRGTEGNHTLVFIDGIKADDPYNAQYDFGGLINDEASRVEVLRGQQSSLYGSDAIGGVISYTTLSGREAPGYSARVEGGTQGTIAGGARAGGVIGDTLDYALSGSYYRTDGFVVAPGGKLATGSENLSVTGKANWTPASNFKLTAVGRYTRLRADLVDQDIAAGSPIIQGYPITIAVDSPGNLTRNRAWYGLVGANWDLFDGAWTNAATAAITDSAREYDGPFGPSGSFGRRYRTTFNSTVRFGSERVKNRFTLGMDWERQQFRNNAAFADNSQHTLDTLGYVASYDLTIDDRLAFGASARIDDYSLFRSAATYRVTGSYLFPTGTRVHAAYGTGIKAPTPSELFGYSSGVYIGNPNLKPEESKGWEAGIEQGFLDRKVTLGATYFRSRFDNQITSTSVFDPISGTFVSSSFNNAVVSHQQGVEVVAAVKLADFRVDANYTYLDAPQTLSALVGNAPAGGGFQAAVPVTGQAVRRARDIASLNVTYAPKAFPISATLTVRYNGGQRDSAFTGSFQRVMVNLPSYTIVNLNASYDFGPHFQVFGRVENLAGERYQEVFGYNSPGRSATGGVRVKF
ncbi:TonB-dependent receptor plug domain-containing protein [Sphingomonas immobilis]|uniref:TonB-dependent receptor n=1 Tax=Sphingomonas immobilis TaxID=3063997 RepID=A0ABT9A1U0_9SPHN|nr:TonB-dependent receptor [Sphingomonas sp. CA1-15]MDO7843789.1 TonB-dependent receptor [Sphingomonas sp. CA1-15]